MGALRRAEWMAEYLPLNVEVYTELARRMEGRRVRSRAQWTEKGERSSRYFYRCMKARNLITHMSTLLDRDNKEVTSEVDMQKQMVEFYSEFFAADTTNSTTQDKLLASWEAKISRELTAQLDAAIQLEEVMGVIKAAPKTKLLNQMGLLTSSTKLISAKEDGQCQVCHAGNEDIRHYFLECPCIQRFWCLVKEYLESSARQTDPRTDFKIDVDKVIFGFDEWSSILPNAETLHGLALWEIFRAHTEAALDNSILTPQAMFARWRKPVLECIIRDFSGSRSKHSKPA